MRSTPVGFARFSRRTRINTGEARAGAGAIMLYEFIAVNRDDIIGDAGRRWPAVGSNANHCGNRSRRAVVAEEGSHDATVVQQGNHARERRLWRTLRAARRAGRFRSEFFVVELPDFSSPRKVRCRARFTTAIVLIRVFSSRRAPGRRIDRAIQDPLSVMPTPWLVRSVARQANDG
jgi:hypothetical protein